MDRKRTGPDPPSSSPAPTAGIALFVVFSLGGSLLLLLLLEGAIALALRSSPGSGPALFEEARRRYHIHHERSIVQYRPECAEYAPGLGYRMKPGTCRFTTRVFDTELEINSLGTRDGEDALSAPRIVVAGDSYAMGWGVEQEEMFSAQLARITGRRTLNLGVSSYGTAREMLLLQRADLSAADTLVIQYCENDFAENLAYVRGGGHLQTMSRERYEAAVQEHLETTRYTPGKYLRRVVPLLWRGSRGWPEPDPARPCERDAAAFLGVLRLADPPPRPLRVVVFEGLYGPEHRTCFIDELRERARSGELPAWITELRPIDVTALLTNADYLPLDGHLNASGHRKIAEAVAEVLRAKAE
jgi:lysophospholipase L1-like esterase